MMFLKEGYIYIYMVDYILIENNLIVNKQKHLDELDER